MLKHYIFAGNCNNCLGDFLKREGTCHQQSSCFREQYYDFINMVSKTRFCHGIIILFVSGGKEDGLEGYTFHFHKHFAK